MQISLHTITCLITPIQHTRTNKFTHTQTKRPRLHQPQPSLHAYSKSQPHLLQPHCHAYTNHTALVLQPATPTLNTHTKKPRLHQSHCYALTYSKHTQTRTHACMHTHTDRHTFCPSPTCIYIVDMVCSFGHLHIADFQLSFVYDMTGAVLEERLTFLVSGSVVMLDAYTKAFRHKRNAWTPRPFLLVFVYLSQRIGVTRISTYVRTVQLHS